MKAFRDSLSSRIHYERLARYVASILAIALAVTIGLGFLFKAFSPAQEPIAGPTISTKTSAPASTPTKSARPRPPVSSTHVALPPSPPTPSPSGSFVVLRTAESDFRDFVPDPDSDGNNMVASPGGALSMNYTYDATDVYYEAIEWVEVLDRDEWQGRGAKQATATLLFEHSLQEQPPDTELEELVSVAVELSIEGACASRDAETLKLNPTEKDAGKQPPDKSLSPTCLLPGDPGSGDIRVGIQLQVHFWNHDTSRSIALDLQLQEVKITFS